MGKKSNAKMDILYGQHEVDILYYTKIIIRDISHDLIKSILSLEMKSKKIMDIRLSATIVKFDGWENRIVNLTSESKNINYNLFCCTYLLLHT